ncbi:hypothetical protein V8C35DRAFT_314568 [Trichoderma chlorosporum]
MGWRLAGLFFVCGGWLLRLVWSCAARRWWKKQPSSVSPRDATVHTRTERGIIPSRLDDCMQMGARIGCIEALEASHLPAKRRGHQSDCTAGTEYGVRLQQTSESKQLLPRYGERQDPLRRCRAQEEEEQSRTTMDASLLAVSCRGSFIFLTLVAMLSCRRPLAGACVGF